jgi:hypothetical protein
LRESSGVKPMKQVIKQKRKQKLYKNPVDNEPFPQGDQPASQPAVPPKFEQGEGLWGQSRLARQKATLRVPLIVNRT